ncbi:right-handed parallel beta-helix repeat-containing protein [Pseudoprimorskyibacter insulae]|uniref:right-handed parallel beta-helix repeat-containing protein n=1 Tax=Pseudoprimorskyibacter insulae TaxID=1695997 RepID=UPI0015E851FB|nr:right-handed parallel beta-helix repeat-containing protein [Pseudoprimorskyibacter insulae]
MKHIAKQALGACFSMVFCAIPAMSGAATIQEVEDLRSALRGFAATVGDTQDTRVQADALIGASGLTGIVDLQTIARPTGQIAAAAPQRGGMVDARPMDVRFALGLIAQIYGAKDNLDIIEAQANPSGEALVINRGTVTLAEIFRQLDRTGLQSAADSADGVLRVPVIIWAEGAIELGPQDRVIMSREHGAFLANFGRMTANGTEFTTVGGMNPKNTDFIPFVVNAGGASVELRNSVVDGLGFGSEGKFGGFSLVRNPLMVKRDRNVLENNTFRNLVSVTTSMADGVVIRNNRISDSRGPSLVVTHSIETRLLGNLISGNAPTNGIRLLQGSARGIIAGNIILEGDRAGIVVQNDSNNVIIRNNIVWARGGGGITISKSRCGLVEANLVMDNRQKGIEVRSTPGVTVRSNRIYGNRSAALWVSDQEKEVITHIEGNDVNANGSGIATAQGEVLALMGNDFTKQFPRFVDGDISPQGRLIASNLDGSVPVVLTAGGVYTGAAQTAGCEY